MKIIRSEKKEWLQKEGNSKKIFIDEKDLNFPGALVQELRVKPGEKAGIHYHKEQTEIFYFLTENGYWIINGEKMTFKKGDVLVIEPFDKHTVHNNTKEDYIYVAFKLNYIEKDLYWS